MRIVLAPDSFKESMTAVAAAAAMARGVRRVLPEAVCLEVPMADGGEGTTEALLASAGGVWRPAACRDSLGRPIEAGYGSLQNGAAVIEVASAVGLGLIAPDERDVMRSSSLGVADLVLAALDAGAEHLIVGLGGSATTDGGAGLLAGLGAALLDEHGRPIEPHPLGLAHLATVDLTGLDPRLARLRIELACDVTNPLLGSQGSAAVFAPQKGASVEQVPVLDATLERLVNACVAAGTDDVRALAGAGAAGGLGAAFLMLGAVMRRGVEVVAEAAGLDAAVAMADLVLTGEGSLDEQTLSGKTPAGVAEVAGRHGVPVIGFAGRLAPGAEDLVQHGFVAVVPILRGVSDLPTALAAGEQNLELAVETTMRLMMVQFSLRGA